MRSLILKSGGLSSVDSSSPMTMGLAEAPSGNGSFSIVSVVGKGTRAFRVVAKRAKLARGGATHDAAEDTVVTEEMEDAREERELSLTIDSGLERDESELLIDGLRVRHLLRPIGGKSSFAQRLKALR